jgi:hypothetical protein
MARNNYDSMRMIAKTISLPSEVFKELMDRVSVEFQGAFELDYSYDRPEGISVIRENGVPKIVRGSTGTLRENGDHLSEEGDLPYAPRDIVDLGALQDSQQRIDMPNATLFRWTGNGERDYALFVHDGYTPKLLGRDCRPVPGRPWTLPVLLRMRTTIAETKKRRLRGG